MKKVIEADSNRLIEEFEESETAAKVEYYENLGEWGDVSVDGDGDIILWEE